jgi:hypothetical protein
MNVDAYERYFTTPIKRNDKSKDITKYSDHQIRRALSDKPPFTLPRSGRPTVLTIDEEQQLIKLVVSSQAYHLMSFQNYRRIFITKNMEYLPSDRRYGATDSVDIPLDKSLI